MQYMGGKARQGKKIAEFINKDIEGYKDFYEPFVGGFNIIPHIKTTGSIYASDIHLPLICLYQALQQGLVLPDTITEKEYLSARKYEDTNPLKAFIGFGCGFGGDYFHGYARSKKCSNYALAAKTSLLKKTPHINKSIIKQCDYKQSLENVRNAVIYLDPPYYNTTEYKNKGFNHTEFWECVRELANKGNIVYITEYTAPPDIPVVYTFERKVSISRTKSANITKQENLYRLTKEDLIK